MRDAARALDDVSDHLGEVLRHADELLADWSRFGAQVRTQVDAEVSAIGEVVDGAVMRAANAGVDRAIADRLKALTGEIERLEQRARAASRAVADHQAVDRRVLWAVVAGVVLANALLVLLLLRKPEVAPAPAVEPVRIETAQPAPVAAPDPAAGSAAPTADAVTGGAAPDPAATGNPGTAAGSADPAPPGDSKGSAAARGGPAIGKSPVVGGKPSAIGGSIRSAPSAISLPRPARPHG
jgi:hypothetical protein